MHIFNLVFYILSYFILLFVLKYTYNIDKIHMLMETKMIKKKDQSYQSAYYSTSYTTSSPAYPQVSIVSLMDVLI